MHMWTMYVYKIKSVEIILMVSTLLPRTTMKTCWSSSTYSVKVKIQISICVLSELINIFSMHKVQPESFLGIIVSSN